MNRYPAGIAVLALAVIGLWIAAGLVIAAVWRHFMGGG